MDHGHAHRPTSGASAAELVAQLREARHRTRRLTEDLSSSELMGPQLDIVNPVLWEIGHVGWFHEYWTLAPCPWPRAADRARRPAVGFERRRPCHALAARPAGPRRHLSLPGRRAGPAGGPAGRRARRRTRATSTSSPSATRTCMSRRWPIRARRCPMRRRRNWATRAVRRRARLPGDVAVPGGTLAAGLDGRRRLRLRQREMGARDRAGALPHRPRARHQRRVRGLRRGRRLRRPGILERRRLGHGGSAATPSGRSTGRPSATACGRVRRYRERRGAGAARAGRVRQLVRGRGVVPLGRAAPAERSRMGGGRHRRADGRRLPPGRPAPALAVGRRAADARPRQSRFRLRRTGRCRGLSRPATAPSAAGR